MDDLQPSLSNIARRAKRARVWNQITDQKIKKILLDSVEKSLETYFSLSALTKENKENKENCSEIVTEEGVLESVSLCLEKVPLSPNHMEIALKSWMTDSEPSLLFFWDQMTSEELSKSLLNATLESS